MEFYIISELAKEVLRKNMYQKGQQSCSTDKVEFQTRLNWLFTSKIPGKATKLQSTLMNP